MIENIKERVGAYLERTGITRQAFATLIGVGTRETLNNKLEGKTEFTFSEIVRLCDVLGCTPNDLREPLFKQPSRPT